MSNHNPTQVVKAGLAFQHARKTDPKTQAACTRLKTFATTLQHVANNLELKTVFKKIEETKRQYWQVFANIIRDNIRQSGDKLAAQYFDRPESIEDWEHLARIVEIPERQIGGLTCGEIFDQALVWADRQRIKAKLASAATANRRRPFKAKKQDERGTRVKLIAALTKHHQYADGGCLNFEPIGSNQLARLAGVGQRTASAFFKKEFQEHAKYKAVCSDTSRLVAALKLLNNEFAPHLLYGDNLPKKADRHNNGDNE